MLNGIHFLLSYACNYECDHCFLYCSPSSKGTFTLKQIKRVLDEAVKTETVEWIYWEGGEPFLYYPLMLEGMKLARERGFKNGIVTNSYWATNTEDAKLWLKPISKLSIADFSVSDDTFHYDDTMENLAKYARIAAQKLSIPVGSINIEKPTIKKGVEKEQEKGIPVIGGGAMFRGRAVDTLIEGLPTRKWECLKECPYEDLTGLGRIHVDCFGNAQICQGLSIGNFWEKPLSQLISEYAPEEHPICGPLIRGGPARLVEKYDLNHEKEYVDECHLCYLARKTLIDKFPEFLGPRQVYGI
ncbi:MAG: radical SAM protein [Promethearchaeota archaeon]|nr:MAG: radical SAM protein [Candidatus Lokiarchaeota archaeon]